MDFSSYNILFLYDDVWAPPEESSEKLGQKINRKKKNL